MGRFEIIDGYPHETEYKYVGEDDEVCTAIKSLIGTEGINTCVGITLYDPKINARAIAHVTGFSEEERLRPANVIETLVDELGLLRQKPYEHKEQQMLEAALAGAWGEYSLGKIITPIRAELESRKITIIGEDVGNNPRTKLMFLDRQSGNVRVYRARSVLARTISIVETRTSLPSLFVNSSESTKISIISI